MSRLPACTGEGEPCPDCRHGTWRRCPIFSDPAYRDFLRATADRVRYQVTQRELRVEALASVLERHAVPLHWEIIARIVREQHPYLFPNNTEVLTLLNRDSAHFAETSDGVYVVSGAG